MEVVVGSRLFEVCLDDGPNAREPYLMIVEYLVERVTKTTLVVCVDRRGEREAKHKTQQRWSRARLEQTVFSSALAALKSYADRQGREALSRRNEAERAERRAQWARVEAGREQGSFK